MVSADSAVAASEAVAPVVVGETETENGKRGLVY